MKFVLSFLSVLVLTSILLAQEKKDEIISSEMKSLEKTLAANQVTYPGDVSIDITYYKLVLKIDEVNQSISGNTTIGFKSNTQSMNSFFLDLSKQLTVDSVLLQSKKLTFSHSTDSLVITLDHTYNINDKISVVVFYHGLPASTGFGSFQFGTHNHTPVIWSLSEPYGARNWFPCKDTPADKADSSDVWITCNSNFKAGSNGILQETINNGDGTTTYKWKNHYPIAQYLISVAVTNYAEYRTYFRYTQKDSMPVINYVYPELLTDSLKKVLNRTVFMLQIFSQRYGLYPFIKEKYGHSQFGWNGGMEHQTMTSITSGSFAEDLVSHELSHQWFGDKVTCKDWHHIWLNEGFATYSQGVYREGAYGKQNYDNFIQGQMNRAKNASGTIYVQDISNESEIFNSSRTYSKGGVVLHMLRGIVGDSTFFNILRTYASDPSLAYGDAVTEDFQRVAESVYGSSLDYFFKEWIYGDDYPVYSLNWNAVNTSGNLYNVDLKVSQAVKTNPSFFTMPVQLNIKTSSGDTIVTVFNNQLSQEYNIVVKGQPSEVVFDPGNWILKDVSITTGIAENMKAGTYKLYQNYPNPFNPATVIDYQLPVTGLVQLKVYDILGNEVVSLVNKEQTAGEYQVKFSPSEYGLSSGIYFYELKAGGFVQSRKMVYLK